MLLYLFKTNKLLSRRACRPEMEMCVVVIYTVAGTKVGSPSSCVSKEFFKADNAFAEEKSLCHGRTSLDADK